MDFLSKQLRKPSGLFGRYLLPLFFDRGNSDLDDFVFHNIELKETDHVLEIGFGTGNLLRRIANATPRGKAYGVEIADSMMSLARKRNRKEIKNGAVHLVMASIESLPYNDQSFDKVCSNNTIYFWPHPSENAKEIKRVLKPGGKLSLGFRDRDALLKTPITEDVFTLYTKPELAALFENAGFIDVDITERQGTATMPSTCLVAFKPMS